MTINEGGVGSGYRNHPGRKGTVGGSLPSVGGIAAHDIKSGTGTSIALSGARPKTGYMVSLPGSERQYPQSNRLQTIREEVKDYVAQYHDKLDHVGTYLGGWIDHGMLSLDTSINMQDRKAALAFGHVGDQIGIYDLTAHDTIYTMSDHLRPSESKGRKITEAIPRDQHVQPGPNAKRFYFDTSKASIDEIASEIAKLAKDAEK